MKKSSFFAASVAAASATAISSSPSSSSNEASTCNDSKLQLSLAEARLKKDQKGSISREKFAPRFDGLRFIETLVTAHR